MMVEPLSVEQSLLRSLEDFVGHVGETTDTDTIWGFGRDLLNRLIGHRMFTVLLYDKPAGLVSRLYSDRPEHYPVGGTKKMGPTPWGDLVLHQGKPFLGSDEHAMSWAFPDHEYLSSIGMASVLNLPMRVGGRTFGTVNLTHQAGHFKNEHIETGMIVAAILTPLVTIEPEALSKV